MKSATQNSALTYLSCCIWESNCWLASSPTWDGHGIHGWKLSKPAMQAEFPNCAARASAEARRWRRSEAFCPLSKVSEGQCFFKTSPDKRSVNWVLILTFIECWNWQVSLYANLLGQAWSCHASRRSCIAGTTMFRGRKMLGGAPIHRWRAKGFTSVTGQIPPLFVFKHISSSHLGPSPCINCINHIKSSSGLSSFKSCFLLGQSLTKDRSHQATGRTILQDLSEVSTDITSNILTNHYHN